MTFGWFIRAEASVERGTTLGTENQSDFLICPFVCSSKFLARSGRVNLCLASSSLLILPVKATGWKLMPLITSQFSRA